MLKKFIFTTFCIVSLFFGGIIGFFSVKSIIKDSTSNNLVSLDKMEIESPENLSAQVENINIGEVKGEQKTNTDQKKDEQTKKDDVNKKEKNDCPTPKKDYEDQTYKNVGQDIALEDKTYIPSGLVELPKEISKYDNLCVKEEVRDALIAMTEDAKKEKLSIKVSSGFRDFSTQKSILDTNIKSGNKDANKLVAKPGYSEHQLGVAVDLTSPSIDNASATSKFGNTKESDWLKINAYKYGFIESYPEGKEDITGYLYEPWHYRYVGIDNALTIFESGKTINQFFEEIKDQNKTTS